MKIGFDAKRYFFNKTGLGNYSRAIVHALASCYPDDEFILFSKKTGNQVCELTNLHSIVPVKPTFLWRTYGIVQELKSQKVDVFHGLSNEIPVGLGNSGIKGVVTIHDVIFKRYPHYYPIVDRTVYQVKTAHALKNADVIVATSMATAQDIVKFFRSDEMKIKVVYQPVSDIWYTPAVQNKEIDKPYWVYVSSFNQRKNHLTLIEAFSRIHKQTEHNLVLLGASGDTSELVKGRIKSLGLINRVFIKEDIGQEQLIQWVKQASGFVYPSFFEGFGIPLAEAIVSGLPVAASDIPVFRELAGDAALYFHPNKSDEIADALLQLDSAMVKSQLEKGRDEVLKKINPLHIASQLMELYR